MRLIYNQRQRILIIDGLAPFERIESRLDPDGTLEVFVNPDSDDDNGGDGEPEHQPWEPRFAGKG